MVETAAASKRCSITSPQFSVKILPFAMSLALRIDCSHRFLMGVVIWVRVPRAAHQKTSDTPASATDRWSKFRSACSRQTTFTHRLLLRQRGTKPSELPVQAAVKFELVINLKTAKAVGIDVPLQ